MTKKVQRFTTSTYRPLSEPGAEVGTTRLNLGLSIYIQYINTNSLHSSKENYGSKSYKSIHEFSKY